MNSVVQTQLGILSSWINSVPGKIDEFTEKYQYGDIEHYVEHYASDSNVVIDIAEKLGFPHTDYLRNITEATSATAGANFSASVDGVTEYAVFSAVSDVAVGTVEVVGDIASGVADVVGDIMGGIFD